MSASAAPPGWTGRTAPPFEPGEEFGCWVILRSAEPDRQGRARYEARARCCGRKVVKGRADLLRCASACSHCADRTGKAAASKAMAAARSGLTRRGRRNACAVCGMPGHKSATCASRRDVSPWVRCKLSVPVSTSVANQQAQPFARCACLVLRGRVDEHLRDVHELEQPDGEALASFEPVDPRQGRGENA
jgi:hypothetical protein